MYKSVKKGEKGITLVVLVIIIIVLSIILGVTYTTIRGLIQSTNAKKYATIMYMLKSQIEKSYDEYSFSGERSDLIGKKIDIRAARTESRLTEILRSEVNTVDYNKYYLKDSDGYNATCEFWYMIDLDTLKSIGIDGSKIANNTTKVFIVNYVTNEIIYTPGYKLTSKGDSGQIERTFYTLRSIEDF